MRTVPWPLPSAAAGLGLSGGGTAMRTVSFFGSVNSLIWGEGADENR
jgi:hypothetical protein